MPGLTDWFEVFRTGTHTDSKGREKTWTTEDLDKMVSNFSEAPVVIGHPKSTDPAFGWIGEVKRDGEKLLAKCKSVISEFESAVEEGLYPNRSISVDRNTGIIRHVGFLGAVPPAVSGLEPINFNAEDEDAEVFEFMDAATANRVNAVGDILQGLRDFMIEKYGLDTTDKVLGQWNIDYLKSATPDETAPQEVLSAFCQKLVDSVEIVENPDPKKDEANAEFSQAVPDEKDTIIAQLEADNKKLRNEANQKEYSSFCQDLLNEGKLTPVQKDYASEFMAKLEDTDSFDFADAGEKSSVEHFKDFLKTLPVQVDLTEFAKKDNADDTSAELSAKELANEAKAYQFEQAQNGVTISITEAVNTVKKKKEQN